MPTIAIYVSAAIAEIVGVLRVLGLAQARQVRVMDRSRPGMSRPVRVPADACGQYVRRARICRLWRRVYCGVARVVMGGRGIAPRSLGCHRRDPLSPGRGCDHSRAERRVTQRSKRGVASAVLIGSRQVRRRIHSFAAAAFCRPAPASGYPFDCRSQRGAVTESTAPRHWTTRNAGTSVGLIPETVSVRALAIVTAGFASSSRQ